MHHNLDRRTVEALLRLQALLPGTLIRRARVRRILVDEVAGGALREHVAAKQIKIQGVGGGKFGPPLTLFSRSGAPYLFQSRPYSVREGETV